MSESTITIHNIQTDEVIIREMNEEELAQFNADISDGIANEETFTAKSIEREALLTKLGITADEAKLLLS